MVVVTTELEAQLLRRAETAEATLRDVAAIIAAVDSADYVDEWEQASGYSRIKQVIEAAGARNA